MRPYSHWFWYLFSDSQIKPFSETRKGEFFVILSIVPWALFPVLAKILVSSIPPIFATAVSMLLASFFFGFILIWNQGWQKWQQITVWKEIFLSTVLIGIISHAMGFWAMQYTTAGNAAILGLSQVLFTFLFFGIWHQEQHLREHIWGSVCMVLGAFLVLFKNTFSAINIGDIAIIFTGMIGPVGNFFQQKVVKAIGAHFHLFIRSFISSIALFILSWKFEGAVSLDLLEEHWWIFLLNGILAFGLSKFLFLEAFRFISVSKAVALGSGAPIVTLLYAYIILGEVPTLWQICGLFPIIIGIFFLTRK